MNIYSVRFLNRGKLTIKADKISMRGDTIVFSNVLSVDPINGNDGIIEDVAYINKNFVEFIQKLEVK